MAAHGVTRQRMLESARTLFGRQGLHGTGINQVLTEGEAPKGSLYFHFPGGKQQLAAEAMAMSADQLAGAISAVIERSADPPAAIRTMAATLGALLEESDFRDGCPMATVALESAGSDPVREACRTGYQKWLDLIADDLRKHGAAAKSEELALLVLSALEGALILARVQRTIAPLIKVADRVATVVAEELSHD